MRSMAAVGIISMLLVFSYIELPSFEEVDYIIHEMETAMFIHEWYIENDYHREYTGSVAWHLKWVDTYNRTINLLVSYRSLLEILNGGIYLK